MKSVQALLVDCSPEWESMFRQLKIQFVSSSSLDIFDKIEHEKINPSVVFVHLSYKKMGASHEKHPFVSELFQKIPEHTRRILFCNGMDRPTSAKNAAIRYEGDILVDGMKLHNETNKAYTLHKKSPCEVLVDKGYASPEEIARRGKTILLENGEREGVTVPPERKADERYHPYDDKEYIQNVKNREQEK